MNTEAFYNATGQAIALLKAVRLAVSTGNTNGADRPLKDATVEIVRAIAALRGK